MVMAIVMFISRKANLSRWKHLLRINYRIIHRSYSRLKVRPSSGIPEENLYTMVPENKPLDGSIALTYNFPMYSTFMTSMTKNKENEWVDS